MKNANSLVAALTVLVIAITNSALARGNGGGGSKSGNRATSSSADYRSAESGKYVKKEYADKNKGTTVRESRKSQ